MDRLIVLMATLLVATGCLGSTVKQIANAVPSDCPESILATGEFEVLTEDLPDNPEGLAMARDGRLYISTPDTVFQVAADGTRTSLASVPAALGLALSGGDLYIAGFTDGNLYHMFTESKVTRTVAAGLGHPNYPVVTPWATLLVADDTVNRVSEVTFDGVATVWTDLVPTPNGIVFSADGATAYVASTFAVTDLNGGGPEDPGLWALDIVDGAVQPPARKLVTFDAGTTPDGVALDDEGTVYVGLNVARQVARVDPRNGSVEVFEFGKVGPASMAFGRGDFDRCSLYVTNLLGRDVWRLRIGRPGFPTERN